MILRRMCRWWSSPIVSGKKGMAEWEIQFAGGYSIGDNRLKYAINLALPRQNCLCLGCPGIPKDRSASKLFFLKGNPQSFQSCNSLYNWG